MARLINEAIDGHSDELALFLPLDFGDSSQLVTLALRQVYLRSYHTTSSTVYINIIHHFCSLTRQRGSSAGAAFCAPLEEIVKCSLLSML
jgi:hypothetical protein